MPADGRGDACAEVALAVGVTASTAPMPRATVARTIAYLPGRHSATTAEKVRNVSPIKINEFRMGTCSNPTNAFIELYNAGGSTVGDTIRLDIGPKTENVTVASVGTSGAGGTGLTLTAPLKFDHASNLPFSDRGTGVTFSPATRFPHSSNEPVQRLDSAITLDKPLDSSHAINTPVVDAAVTTVGYQGTSGTGQGGCFAPAPGTGRSDIRFPDGSDTDSNCTDFIRSSNSTPGGVNQP